MLASSASGIRISPGARLPGPTAGSPRPRRPGEPNVLAGVGLTHVRSGTNETASLVLLTTMAKKEKTMAKEKFSENPKIKVTEKKSKLKKVKLSAPSRSGAKQV